MSAIDDELVKTIRKIEIETLHLTEGLLAGAYRSAFKGRGIEFEEVREFQPGDEMRSIDWNVTAKMAHPYIKSFREERELTVILIVDASASTRFGSSNTTKNKTIAEVGATFAFSAIKNNDRVGLIVFSDDVDLYIAPRKGTRHVLRIIRELLVTPKLKKGTNLGKALAFFGKVQTRSTICFVISDFMCEDFSREYTVLAKKHDMVTVAVTDPYEAIFPNINLAELTDLETGKQQMVDTGAFQRQQSYKAASDRRFRELQELATRTNSGLIEITTDKAYYPPIEKFFKKRGTQQ